jgi:hypothetical protein
MKHLVILFSPKWIRRRFHWLFDEGCSAVGLEGSVEANLYLICIFLCG